MDQAIVHNIIAKITETPEYSSLRATTGLTQNVTYTGTGPTNSVLTEMASVSPTIVPSFTLAANQVTINEDGFYLLSYSSINTINTSCLHHTALYVGSVALARSIFAASGTYIPATVTGTYQLFAGNVITLRTYIDGCAPSITGTIQGASLTILKLGE